MMPLFAPVRLVARTEGQSPVLWQLNGVCGHLCLEDLNTATLQRARFFFLECRASLGLVVVFGVFSGPSRGLSRV